MLIVIDDPQLLAERMNISLCSFGVMDRDIAQYIPKQNILMKVDRSTRGPVYTIDVHTSRFISYEVINEAIELLLSKDPANSLVTKCTEHLHQLIIGL